jgi:hypothetical protein
MGPGTLAQNVVAASPTLRQESDIGRGCTDTYRITPMNTSLGRPSTGRKGWPRGLAMRSQTRAVVSTSTVLALIFQALHRAPSLHLCPNSPKSPTMMTSIMCSPASRIWTLSKRLLRVLQFHSPYRLEHRGPTLFKLFRHWRNHRHL